MPNIVVCVKHSYDVQQLKFDPTTRQPMLSEAPKRMSDMDRRAVEEAVRIKEKYGGRVIVVTVGKDDAVDSIKLAYAMGADEGYLLFDSSADQLDTTTVAKALSEAIKRIGNYDLVLCGSASTDGYSWQVPSKLATFLGIPIAVSVRSLEFRGDHVVVECDFEDAIYKYKLGLPAVVAVTLDINEPRSPTLSAILRASRRPITTWNVEDLGVKTVGGLKVVEVKVPEVKRRRVILDATDERKIPEVVQKLVEELRREGLVR